MIHNGIAPARLLPWETPEGKPCYLLGDGRGRISRIADTVESAQLDMAGDLLDQAADMIEDHEATTGQLRFLVARMGKTLNDVRRIAESRGARLLPYSTVGTDSGADDSP